jgi:pimeloyl-ACP methyl ester carboxylesterase
VLDADLVLIHGFWSSPGTWDRVIRRFTEDPDLSGLRVHCFSYSSPKLRLPFSPVRIPAYDDIAQALPAYLDAHTAPDAPLAFVTHSQGGLILQRYLAWMLSEGRGRDLARVRLIVMLSCPNEGSEYLASIRAVAGFGRHPQARELSTLAQTVADTRRIVLRQIVNATTVDQRQCPIPVHVYAGTSDNIVRRVPAQSAFPQAATLPGNHFSILDVDAPQNLTYPTLKRSIKSMLAQPFTTDPAQQTPAKMRPPAETTTSSAGTHMPFTDRLILDIASVVVPSMAIDFGEVRFSLSNYTDEPAKVISISLRVVSHTVAKSTVTKVPAAPIDEYFLFARLEVETDSIELLEAHHVLAPSESDGFFLKIEGPEGYIFELKLEVTWNVLGVPDRQVISSPSFLIEFPSHSPAALLSLVRRAREGTK